MGAQKNVPKIQKVELLTLACLFVKRKFKETLRISLLTTPATGKVGRRFSVLTLLLTKLPNILAQTH